jgi:type I restriction enzyme S subunit
MPDQPQDRCPYLVLTNTSEAQAFKAPSSGGGGSLDVPAPDRAQHGASLKAQLVALTPVSQRVATFAANIAKTGILKFDACFPDSVVRFRASHRATVEYVRVWLSFLQKALEDAVPESAQKNINLAILRGLKVPVPPLALQQTFATRMQAVESLKATHRAALAKSDALFASLHHQAFSGSL